VEAVGNSRRFLPRNAHAFQRLSAEKRAISRITPTKAAQKLELFFYI